MLSLKGKTAVVTGSKRLGSVVVKRLAQEGINLAIVYKESLEEVLQLREEVLPYVEKVHLIQADVNVEEDVQRLLNESKEELGQICFLVNLASGFLRATFSDLNGQEWDRAMADAKGNYLLAVYAARHMMNNPGNTKGHIIMCSDTSAGETPHLNYLPHLTAKAAVNFMGRAFALELASSGILVNTIAPGPTVKPPRMDQETWERNLIDKTPLKRESSSEEIADLILTLLRSETITGETIRVDSGNHLGKV